MGVKREVDPQSAWRPTIPRDDRWRQTQASPHPTARPPSGEQPTFTPGATPVENRLQGVKREVDPQAAWRPAVPRDERWRLPGEYLQPEFFWNSFTGGYEALIDWDSGSCVTG